MTVENEINDLKRQLSGMSGATKKIAYDLDKSGVGKAAASLSKDLKRSGENQIRATKGLVSEMGNAATSMSAIGRSMTNLARALPGGVVLGALSKYANETVSTYKQLTQYGHNFGGSMVNMSIAAGKAGVPLEKFAAYSKEASGIIAQSGQRFFEINKAVREATDGMGNFGYSMNELYKMSTTYFEQQRLMNTLGIAHQQRHQRVVVDLMSQMSALSKVTGKQREAIMADAAAALQNSVVVAQMQTMAERGLHHMNENLTKATNGLAAQLGDAGKKLAEGLTQTVALHGAQFSGQANQFLEAGFSEGVLLLQQASDKLARGVDGDTVQRELVASLKDAVDNPTTRAALVNQARAGNAAAIETLAMAQNLKKITAEEMAKAKAETRRMDILTGLFSAMESIFGNLRGSLIEGFLKPFGTALEGSNFEKTLESMKKTFKVLEPTFVEMGESWGTFVKNFIADGGVKTIVQQIGNAAKAIVKFTSVVFSPQNVETAFQLLTVFQKLATFITAFITTIVIPPLTFLVDCLSVLSNVINSVAGQFGGIGEKAGAAISGAIAIFSAMWIKRFISNRVGSMTVRAGVVNVVGGGGFGGGLGGGLGGGAPNGPNGKPAGRFGRLGGRLAGAAGGVAMLMGMGGMFGGIGGGGIDAPNTRAMGAAAGAAGDVAKTTGKTLGKTATKGAGKSLLKKIPGVGLVSGLAFGAGRAMQGDWVGAGLEVASGAASTIPGLGTAASVGLDLALMGRDMTGASDRAAQASQERRRSGRGGGLMSRLGRYGGMGALALGGLGVGAIGINAGRTLWNNYTKKDGEIDTAGNTERMAAAAVANDPTAELLKDLGDKMERFNKISEESRQINTAQLDAMNKQIAAQQTGNRTVQDQNR